MQFQHNEPRAPTPPRPPSPPFAFPGMSGPGNNSGHVLLDPNDHHSEHNIRQLTTEVVQRLELSHSSSLPRIEHGGNNHVKYHYNRASEAISLSTGQETNQTLASGAERSLSSDELSARFYRQTTNVRASHSLTNGPALASRDTSDPWSDHREIWTVLDSDGKPRSCSVMIDRVRKRYYSNERTPTMLKVFDVDIPEPDKCRFRELCEIFERLLQEYMENRGLNLWVSIHLEVFGTSEATAAPCIIVVCKYTEKREVKTFFRQQHVRSEYKPPKTTSLPRFRVLFCYRPPGVRSSESISSAPSSTEGGVML